MDRKAARELAQTTLQAIGSFQQVHASPRRSFDGESPITVILSRSLGIQEEARSLYTVQTGLVVTIYVRCEGGQEDATEDLFDELVTNSLLALRAAGFTIDSSDATPDGAPLRNIDGIYYRAERITLRLDDEHED